MQEVRRIGQEREAGLQTQKDKAGMMVQYRKSDGKPVCYSIAIHYQFLSTAATSSPPS